MSAEEKPEFNSGFWRGVGRCQAGAGDTRDLPDVNVPDRSPEH